MSAGSFKEVAKRLWGNAVGSGTGSSMSGPAAEALGAAGAALGVIAAIYAAYCVAVMLIQAVYKCTEDEIGLTAMRDVGNCHFIGSYCDSKVLGMCVKKIRSYCCFSSPLSRIIQEQLRKQGDRLGADFRTLAAPRNRGARAFRWKRFDELTRPRFASLRMGSHSRKQREVPKLDHC